MRRSFGHEDLHLLQDLCDLPQCLQVFRIDSELIHNRVSYRFQLSTLESKHWLEVQKSIHETRFALGIPARCQDLPVPEQLLQAALGRRAFDSTSPPVPLHSLHGRSCSDVSTTFLVTLRVLVQPL